jgi:UDP-2,3-diacylglucosamine pyrophosphatase LpxH
MKRVLIALLFLALIAGGIAYYQFNRTVPTLEEVEADFEMTANELYSAFETNEKEALEKFEGKENEWLYCYAEKKLKEEHFDYFIFGHRHLPLDLKVNNNSQYLNLGDWINYYSYAEFDGENLSLKYFDGDSANAERPAD